MEEAPIAKTAHGRRILEKLWEFLNANKIEYNDAKTAGGRAASDELGISLKTSFRDTGGTAVELFHEAAHLVWKEDHKKAAKRERKVAKQEDICERILAEELEVVKVQLIMYRWLRCTDKIERDGSMDYRWAIWQGNEANDESLKIYLSRAFPAVCGKYIKDTVETKVTLELLNQAARCN